MYLSISTRERETAVRRRRSAGDDDVPGSMECDENSSEQRCCRWPLRIYFAQDFDWNWILAPRHYDASMCRGTCPHNHLQVRAPLYQLPPLAFY